MVRSTSERPSGLVFIQLPWRLIQLSTTLAGEGSEAISVDTNDLEALIRECSRLRVTNDIVSITGFPGLQRVALCDSWQALPHFVLPAPDSASIEQCCDKFVQRRLLAQAGVPMPASRLAANARDVEGAAAEIGLPVIVKPAVGSGSSAPPMRWLAMRPIKLGETHVWPSAP